MLKRFLGGFAFGTGFAIACAIVYTVWIASALPKVVKLKLGESEYSNVSQEAEETEPPQLTSKTNFLGSPAIYSADFMDHLSSAGVLAAGDGKITAKITVNKEPIEGIRIRYALNGSVMSQWAQTDASGFYAIAVPFGEYRIDGFELDELIADDLLANKINNPANSLSTVSFIVEPGKNGEGLNLDFVDPVIKLTPRGEVPISEDIVATWEPYPGAKSYAIQIYQTADLHGFGGRKALFKWPERPHVTEPTINLSGHGFSFKSGHYYTLEIKAKDETGSILSETPRLYSEKDFKVVD